jgi:hypothetical protein
MTDETKSDEPAVSPPVSDAPTPGDPGAIRDGDRRRLDRRARRRRAAALRDASFEWLADGFTHQEIAAARKISVAAVRRDIAKAIRARQFETREGHAQLQIARLAKGLALVTRQIERGDLAAIGPLVKIVAALDRYQGAGPQPAQPGRARRAEASLAAPPLALTHDVPPLAAGATPEARSALTAPPCPRTEGTEGGDAP